jgi:hypothetical protein
VDDSRKGNFRSSRRGAEGVPAFRTASLRAVRTVASPDVCSVCGGPVGAGEAEEGGVDGSLAWARGDRMDVERVRQCESCAAGLAFTMNRRFEDEDDGG